MIGSYNTEEYGRIVRNIRTALRLTQTEVRQIVGISENTLMKLERGQVIPKFETLELLSLAYKVDLNAIFQAFRQDSSLSSILSQADDAIFNNRPGDLLRCSSQLDEYMETGQHKDLINAGDLEIVQCFLKSAERYFNPQLKDYQRRELIEEIRSVMLKSNPDLKWHKLGQITFNLWEIRLLNILAFLEGQLSHNDIAIGILEAILANYKELSEVIVTERKVLLNSIFNLAYQYHVSDQHDKALETADRGIVYAQKLNDIHLLHGLFYRKGIAQHLLGLPGPEKTLLHAVVLLEIQGKQKMADLYRTITHDTYGIEIP